MENQDSTQSPGEEIQKPEDEVDSQTKRLREDDAGPSQPNNLPGSIPHKASSQLKPGLSKSEHNIRQIHPHKDVAALNITSISFGPQAQAMNTIAPKEPNAPATANSKEETMFIDIKKFMASYFRSNRDNPVTATEDTNAALNTNAVLNANVVLNTIAPERIQVDTMSCVTSAQTEETEIIIPANEVIVTNQLPVEPNLSKSGSDNKKKNSGTVSERSCFGIAQRDSLSSIGSNVCRICMTKGRERLISPCNCKGSLANVHLTCLERWLNQVGRNHCELCGFSYPAIRTPRYTVLQALRLWFGNPRNRSHLQSDCLIFWLLSTVTAGLLAVCIVGTQYFVVEGNKFGKRPDIARKEEGISHRITETAMDFFMAIVLCGYFVTVYLLCKDHYVMWNRWRRANVHVRLLLSPDASPVPFVPRAPYNNIV